MSHIDAELLVNVEDQDVANRIHALSDKEMYGKIEKLENMVIELHKELAEKSVCLSRALQGVEKLAAKLAEKENLWQKAMDHFV